VFFQRATDGEFYNLEKAVKIVYEKGIYKSTFEVPIKLGKNKVNTYIQKYFDNLTIPAFFKKIDSNLYLNFDKMLKAIFFEDYCYLSSSTKKKIGTKYINYNIKVSYKNEKIENILKGETMWIKVNNSYINLDKVTNVFLDTNKNKMIFNFINNSTNLNNVEDIKPEFEVELFANGGKFNEIVDKILENKNWIRIENKIINLENVYNVKVLPTPNSFIVFINFVSNITKQKGNEKIISTEFVKCEFQNEEDVKKLLEKFNIKDWKWKPQNAQGVKLGIFCLIKIWK